MSLDVRLVVPSFVLIVADKHGTQRPLLDTEWNEKFPDLSPVGIEPEDPVLYRDNITHNLNTMAEKAGIYCALWRPDENGLTHARQLIPILEEGLKKLTEDEAAYLPLNPPNGWGDYDGLVSFVRHYLAACRQWPEAMVEVSR